MKAAHLQRFGEANGNAKLTKRDVARIEVGLRAGRSSRDLAREFNVSQSAIQKIRTGQTWPASM